MHWPIYICALLEKTQASKLQLHASYKYFYCVEPYMQSQGQLSFDLIFAFIAVLVLFQFLIFYAEDTATAESRISVRNQERSIALQVKNAVNACLIADVDAANPADTIVSFTIPFVKEVSGSKVSTACTVAMQGTGANRVIAVSHTMADNSLESVSLPLPEYSASVQPLGCGSTVSFFC